METAMKHATDKITILVVDDQEDFRDFLVTYLEGEGFHVLQAEDGEDALTLINNQKPHLVLLDVMMPDKNGYDVCRDIKSSTATADIPIIFVTAKTGLSDKLAGYISGGQRYLCKPFELSELDECVRAVLRQQNLKHNQLNHNFGPSQDSPDMD
jgi:DNA-binding response OmpR family regulator